MSRCGTRSGYTAGCRCEPCRIAHRDYNREWLRKEARIRYGIEERVEQTVDATEAREHLLWLSSQGIGRRQVAKHARLVPSTIQKITSGQRTRIYRETADRILAVNLTQRPANAHVDATRTWEQIDELLDAGWSKARIARHLTGRQTTLSLQLHRDRVTLRHARTIDELWRTEFAQKIAHREWVRDQKRAYRKAQADGR